MKKASKVHVIGIGGIGASGAAKWWKLNGAEVSGSDIALNSTVKEVMDEGISVSIGQVAENIPEGADLVLYSRAVPENNPERKEAKRRGIEEWSYPEFLGELAKEKKTIAVAGTNGKSTTAAMIATILIEAGMDPTVILGTKVPGWEHESMRIGSGDWFVVEACEHMASFLHIVPTIAVVTNIEEDHLDFYRDIQHIRETFQSWIDAVPEGGAVVLNAEDPESQELVSEKSEGVILCDRWVVGERQGASLKSTNSEVDSVEIALSIPAEFNLMNSALAVQASVLAGVPADEASRALELFRGTWRRFEKVGSFKGADVYSDYAHHPTALKGAISAFKEFFPDRRLVVLFEPHQRSRTKELFDDFVTVFEGADVLILSEIYEVAGRNEKEDVSSDGLAAAIRTHGKPVDVTYVAHLEEAKLELTQRIEAGDIVVVMGAGDVDGVARELVGNQY